MHPTVRRSSLLAPRSSLTVALLLLLAALSFAALRPTPTPAATITVTTTADSNPPDGTCSLRRAIQAANGDVPFGSSGAGCTAGSGPDTITFAPNVTGTITLTSSLPPITGTLTIQGPGAAADLTISGGNAVRILEVSAGASLTLHNLTLANGYRDDDTGGAIRNDGTLTLTNSTVSGNQAANGGAILSSASLTITNSTLSGNQATGNGGAIENSGTLSITASTFSENQAANVGGAILNRNNLTITNSTLSGNRAGGSGSAIFSEIGTVAITSSTIAANQSGSAPVFAVIGGSASLRNVVLDNSPSLNCGGAITDLGGNIAGDASCPVTTTTSHNNTDPLLEPLADNGGPTETMELTTEPTSPAIGAGVAPCPATDQRGVPRPAQGCDSGAYETGAAPITAIALTATLDGQPAGSPPGPTVPVGSTLTLTLTVTNAGEVTVTDVTVESLTPGLTWVTGPNLGTLAPGESATGTATITVSEPGAEQVLLPVTAQGQSGQEVSAETTVYYTTVAAPNAPPVAAPDSYTTLEDTTLVAGAPGVLANDSDPDGGELTAVRVQVPANGTVSLSASGSFGYVPAPNFNGTDSFTYRARDASGLESAPATVTISVTAVNDAPSFLTGADQTVLEDAGPQTVANWATAITAGPTDESNQSLTFQVMNSNPSLFSVQPAVSPSGTLTYTPAANASGSATVTVQLQDSGGTANGGVDTSAPRTFTITVTAASPPPMAVDDAATTPQGTPVVINVLANDSGDGITITGVSQPDNGSAAFDASGSIIYTPAPGFAGTDSFSYTITDVVDQQASATVSITVTPAATTAITLGVPTVNGQPAGSPPGPSVPAGSTLTIAVPVTNSGTVDVVVSATSDVGMAGCSRGTFLPGQSITCSVTTTAAAGAQSVTITVTAQRSGDDAPVSESATAFYTGVQAAPTITSITPSSGPEAGGTPVTITGQGFVPGRTSVAFGLTPAQSVSCVNSTQCQAVTPPGIGSVSVSVTVDGQTSPDSAAAGFTYEPPPPPPPQPMTLTGQVWRQIPPLVSEGQSEGTVVPVVGGVVEALVGGVVCGQGVTDRQGRFALTVATDPPTRGCGRRAGGAVTFRVNGQVAASSPLRFQSGGQASVTLLLPGPMPPPRRFGG